ncbi:protein SENESCENCE-ASSOCIATED GENE 21, mitochondrial [Zea mays]|jgi:hypothetical protein|uniref:Zinc inducible protein n=1 Tax=Zea mays TaxID=4577 RepID=K7UXF8_MAIZE|nr:protein SENESCENCE-ASSOCIATED GENE 21, mitochondrial [Zea mays]AQK89592.1 Zinc inducible protein [Zea mays]|eukprot:XP_008655505.1 protein SENESCENCE-ASSOCIATED GENE 21, mitochondrial [Zea mays]
MALALSGCSARAALTSLAPRARGYAASAASGAMRRAAAESAAAGEAKEAGRRTAAAEVSWVPDPVTGHYRPSNWAAAAADPADLRAAHLAPTYARA